ncbi:MAG: ATP-dependent helicase [Geodermatophilaceae bacterium]|nr:ATP-dependent helicase [Geodermatophilaceae bacterium]
MSWRNGAGILGIANDIAKVCADEHLPVVTLTPAPSRTDPGEINCALLTTQIEEVSWLADEIARRWAARVSGEYFAVLSRARSLLRPVAAALRERNVPVEVLGLGGLIDEPEVSDVVATLRVISDPSSGDAIGRLLVGPRWRIGPRDLMALGRRARWLTRQQLAGADSAAQPSAVVAPTSIAAIGESEETGSLIEALDDLGPASAYSAPGHRRLTALCEELSWLRRRSGVSLADLIDDVVATLGLGIEVAVRPAVTHARAQAHLQALHAVAEEYTRIAEVPSLVAFLSYLAAAEDEERGLEPGEVQTSEEAVSLLTVHAAKGLEWDVVAVPGLTKDVFPQNVTARTEHWLTDPGHLPVSLCGDRDYLPDLDLTGVTDQKAAEAAYLEAKKAYQEAAGIEEWRLAYVAVTRARTTLLCSGSWWTGDAKKPRGASAVLELVRDHARTAGPGSQVSVWASPPEDDATNPMSDDFPELAWPVDPLPPTRRTAREAAAALVRNPPEDLMTLDSLAWDAEVDLLLAERDRQRASTIDVALPAQLSVSELVALRRSPNQLARWIRRPLPSAPAPLARRGTAFHAWLEQRFGATRLVDLDELPGSADDGAAPDEDLAELKAAFLASEWAHREPTEVEVPFHVRIGDGLALRGRMDAVFGELTTGFEVVDWKTGAVPIGVEKQATAIQLAAYRLAWASLAGVDVEQVKAAFVYVRHNETVRPADLATAEELLWLVSALPTT